MTVLRATLVRNIVGGGAGGSRLAARAAFHYSPIQREALREYTSTAGTKMLLFAGTKMLLFDHPS